uniref:Uncharacterized protein n=1 Tax=Rhizophora mucronata TaxID=61149 RepID=A0A2P2P6W0_RHIMU
MNSIRGKNIVRKFITETCSLFSFPHS